MNVEDRPIGHCWRRRGGMSWCSRNRRVGSSELPNYASHGLICHTNATKVWSNAPGGCQMVKAESNTATG
jgi:hypothetical protein